MNVGTMSQVLYRQSASVWIQPNTSDYDSQKVTTDNYNKIFFMDMEIVYNVRTTLAPLA